MVGEIIIEKKPKEIHTSWQDSGQSTGNMHFINVKFNKGQSLE